MSDFSKGRVLVTGGAGFIGSALIHHLNGLGLENILVTDFLGEDDKYRNLVPLRFDDYLEADDFLEKMECSPDAFGEISAVFHLGACSATTEKNAAYLIRNNFEYTKRLAGWALARDARFTYASSAATYGDGAAGMDDKNADLAALRPLNMYGYSKHLFDLHAQRAGYLDRIVGLKYFNVFGPNEGHKGGMISMVRRAYGNIAAGDPVKLFRSENPDYRDGEQMRDFVYVKDAVAMSVHLARNRKAGGLYNIGSGVARTWLDLVRPIFKTLGVPEKIEFIPMPSELKAKYQYHTRADITKLLSSGYSQPQFALEDAVVDYVKNHLMPGKTLGE